MSDSSRLLAKAQREGSVRAIVGLRTDFTPEGQLSRAQADDQRAAIESARAGLQADLAGTGYQTLREYETVPYIALELTPEALRAIQNSPTTTTIHEDVAVPPALTESGAIVQAPIMWENNLTGAGKTIAVLDTGVERIHPFLGGRVVEEACYSSGSDCPNGRTTQTGTDSGAPCTYAAEGCPHGTPRRRDRRRAGDQRHRHGTERQHHVGPGLPPGDGHGLQRQSERIPARKALPAT